MAGAYCKFCDRRCFVLRTIPDGPQKGWTGHLATCLKGREHDRQQTGGYDANNTINPADKQARGHVWDHDENGATCTRCGGLYSVWHNGDVYGFEGESIEQDCPGVQLKHGADYGEPGYNPDCDCRNCG